MARLSQLTAELVEEAVGLFPACIEQRSAGPEVNISEFSRKIAHPLYTVQGWFRRGRGSTANDQERELVIRRRMAEEDWRIAEGTRQVAEGRMNKRKLQRQLDRLKRKGEREAA